MSKTIELSDEVYAQLEQRASQRGLTLPQIIAALVHEDEHARITGAIERMRTKGVLLMPSSAIPPAPTDFIPLEVRGKPLSEVIIEERR
jgi:Tfp pilus assembly protein FimV